MKMDGYGYKWERISECNRCGNVATYEFIKKTWFKTIERTFCKECLLEVLREQKLEKTKRRNYPI
jgi:late competence protein required for DNA uptake (superfamily II DNA/RNA helicase)